MSFSGGRDSSAVLALASAVARREGLPLPIPVTLRFPGAIGAEESDWQEAVIAHLKLPHWERLTIVDELDLLGSAATSTLRRHGLMWPTNAYLHVPLLQLSSGGTLMTGVDGDGALGNWRWSRAQSVLHGRTRPRPSDVATVAMALCPPSIRRRSGRMAQPPILRWLRPDAAADFRQAWLQERSEEPRRWDKRVDWYARRRYLAFFQDSLSRLGIEHDVQVVNPLLDGGFLAALAETGGPAGYGDRTEAMSALFGELLPSAVIHRPTKGEFTDVLWRGEARAFAHDWDGRGVDLELVEPEALIAEWCSPRPCFESTLLLHQAWLARNQ